MKSTIIIYNMIINFFYYLIICGYRDNTEVLCKLSIYPNLLILKLCERALSS